MKGRFKSKQQAMQMAIHCWTCERCGILHKSKKPVTCHNCGHGAFTHFASIGEANKGAELRMLQNHGVISELELQPSFPVYAGPPGCLSIEKNGKALFTYTADFRYKDKSGKRFVLDYKGSLGHVTALFARNKLIIESMYQIEIRVV